MISFDVMCFMMPHFMQCATRRKQELLNVYNKSNEESNDRIK